MIFFQHRSKVLQKIIRFFDFNQKDLILI